MPDLTQLAAQIMAALVIATPWLDSVAQGVGKEIGAAGARKAGQLLASLRERFRKADNEEAMQTLALFEKKPQTFASALGEFVRQALEADPAWAAEVAALLRDEALQEIVAKNESTVKEIAMQLSGSGVQRIEADKSTVEDVKMTIKRG